MNTDSLKISFAVTTHNEGQYIADLLNQLVPFCDETADEIVVLDDCSDDEYTLSLLESYASTGAIALHTRKFEGSFADHKNYLNSLCTGDYIFQVDADETLHPTLLKYLHDILENNRKIDLFIGPRVNVVNGITEEDIKRWRWQINEHGWVMFPDWQTRIYRNVDHIHWVGKVHERIRGHETETMLPAEEQWSLYHVKEIERQKRQNAFYQAL